MQLQQLWKRYFEVVRTQTLPQIKKYMFKVVGNLITGMESVSRFELALISKKIINQIDFKNAWGHNDFKLFMLIILFNKYKVFWLNYMKILVLTTL